MAPRAATLRIALGAASADPSQERDEEAVRVRLSATIAGIFEIELDQRGMQLGQLEVGP
jgi:hypothetical protein